MKRLSQPSGALLPHQDSGNDSENQIVRPAILVHSGPEGSEVEFMSGDGPIKFDAARIQRIVNIHNQRINKLADEYGGMDKIPMGAFDPILDSHADESNDRVVGRLTGLLKYEVRDVPKVGKNVACAVADPGITFLGKETVQKVNDGRIYHLSIGINESDDTLGETSTVVQPAAPGAMLLNQGRQNQDNGGSKMDQKRLQAHQEKLSKLSSMKETLVSLTKKTESTTQLMKLAEKKGKITHRLNALAATGRIGRVEFKEFIQNKMDTLTKLDDSALDVALSLLETVKPDSRMELTGKQFGSSSASEVMEMGKAMAQQKDKEEVKRLRAEFSNSYTKLTGKKLSGDKEDEDSVEHSHEMKKKMASGPMEERVSDVGNDPHAVGEQAGEKQLAHHVAALGHHLAAGDIEKAKESHAELSKHLGADMKHMSEFSGDVKSEDYKAHMAQVQMELDDVKTNLSRLGGMVQDLMGAEEEEGKHFGDISKEHGEVVQK